MRLFLPKIVREWRSIYREGGFKLLIRKKGWVILVAFFAFYLVRDSVLYLLLPYLAIRGVISCPGVS
ncbi:MAG: hypothetical protein ACE5HZ_06985 [Fidelibacterota bacterium]